MMGSKKTAKADHRAKAPIDRKRFNGKIYVANDEQKQMSDWLIQESFPVPYQDNGYENGHQLTVSQDWILGHIH
jgi:hypothetical protein